MGLLGNPICEDSEGREHRRGGNEVYSPGYDAFIRQFRYLNNYSCNTLAKIPGNSFPNLQSNSLLLLCTYKRNHKFGSKTYIYKWLSDVYVRRGKLGWLKGSNIFKLNFLSISIARKAVPHFYHHARTFQLLRWIEFIVHLESQMVVFDQKQAVQNIYL